MTNQFFTQIFLPNFADSEGTAIEIHQNMEDVRLYAKSTITKEGPHFMQSDKTLATILEKLTDK